MKLHADFWLHRCLAPLTLELFKGYQKYMQKIFGKNSTHFHDKTAKQRRKRRDFPQSYTKVGHLQTSTANILLSGGRQCFTVKIKNKTGSLFLPLLINIVLNILARVIRQNNKINSITDCKRKSKLSLQMACYCNVDYLEKYTHRDIHTLL